MGPDSIVVLVQQQHASAESQTRSAAAASRPGAGRSTATNQRRDRHCTNARRWFTRTSLDINQFTDEALKKNVETLSC